MYVNTDNIKSLEHKMIREISNDIFTTNDKDEIIKMQAWIAGVSEFAEAVCEMIMELKRV